MRHNEPLGFRTTMLVPVVLFVPTLILGFVSPGSSLGAILGILYHLAVFLVVSRLPAPDWAKAAGYGWLTLDVLAGIMAINAVPYEIFWPVRLAGHVIAGMWIIMTSLGCRPAGVRVVGVVTGAWLALYSFLGTVLPTAVLGPAGVLVIVWLGLLAWSGAEATRTRGVEATPTGRG